MHSRCLLSAQINSNIKNTVTGLKQIVGKKFHSEEIQSEIPKVAYGMVESLGSVAIPVRMRLRFAPPPASGLPS